MVYPANQQLLPVHQLPTMTYFVSPLQSAPSPVRLCRSGRRAKALQHDWGERPAPVQRKAQFLRGLGAAKKSGAMRRSRTCSVWRHFCLASAVAMRAICSIFSNSGSTGVGKLTQTRNSARKAHDSSTFASLNLWAVCSAA